MVQLDRFKEAQNKSYAGFASALAELKAGGKQGHWIWYIFPQLAGLGRSPAAQFYGVVDVPEAEQYIHDPVLRERLIAAAEAVAELHRAGISLTAIMGASVDALKLISSLTLFGSVARKLHAAATHGDFLRLARLAEEILTFAESEGYKRCQYTLSRLQNYEDFSENRT